MSSRRLLGLVAAAVVLIAVILAGIYAYQRKTFPPTPGEPEPVAEQKGEPGKPAAGPEAKKTEATKPTSVPTFDVVRIEPSGDGVIAGRAEPGWSIKLESGGTQVAETTVDEEGAWTVILEKPLPAGAHSLSLRAVAPDGSRALTAQQGVQVAVGPKAAEPQPAEGAPTDQAAEKPTAAEAPPAQPEAAEKPPEVAATEPEIAPEAVPAPPVPPSERPKPPVRIKNVDYVDVGGDSGKITMSGLGDPGVTVMVFFDDAPLGEVVVGSDGTWSFEAEKRLGKDAHLLRVDTINAATGMLAGRASVTLGRAPEVASKEPAPAAPEVAAREEAPGQPVPASPEGAPSSAAPAPSSGATGAPVDLSSQPQPVYPEAKSADVAAATPAPADLSAQPQPVHPEAAPKPSGEIAAVQPEAQKTPEAPVTPLQPVYPQGAPPASAAQPSYPDVVREPQDLSSQPQPVYPEEKSADIAAASPAPADLSAQPQPVHPETEPEPSSETAAAEPEARKEPEAPVTVLQPVYPQGAPPPSAATPSYPDVVPEPQDLSSQPQPVSPDSEPSTSVAASEPSPSSPPVTEEEPSTEAVPLPSVAAPASPSATPEPLSPDGEPSAGTAESSPPAIAAAPQDLGSQPQPVHPPAAEEAPESPEAAAPAPPAPPMVTAEPPGTAKPDAEQAKVVFHSVDYFEGDDESGKIALAGNGNPGARIHLFLNNHPLGEVTVAEDGSWSFETSRKLHTGQHSIRADELEAGTGTVVASASVGMERLEKPATEEVVAAQEPPAAAPPEPAPAPSAETETAAAEEPEPAARRERPRRPRSRIYTVRRGDTLWDIAEEYYGGGWRYRAIVRENRRKIRDPHWIYPKQKFRIPPNR